MTVFLEGVAAKFYCGIGEEMQFIGPFARMNFFIGANNSGKSIILNLLANQVSSFSKQEGVGSLKGPEVYRGENSGQFSLAFGSSIEAILSKVPQEAQERLVGGPRARGPLIEEIRDICNNLSKHGALWAEPNLASPRTGSREPPKILTDVEPEAAKLWTENWYGVWQAMHPGATGGGYEQHWFPQTLKILANYAIPTLPNIHLIPAKRIFGASGEEFVDLSGKGLLNHLQALQNPDFDSRQDEVKFEKINSFIQKVTGKLDARLEVPSNLAHLLVKMDNKVLPLSALGTGIHEVVLIAAFCTIYDESIMCIEEPEIHLHPLLQRKLVRYLLENTKSQYFVATHSAAFIDTPGANVFHVSNDGVQTRVRPALTKETQRKILDDLAYQASDLLQTNAVIWVEGPSDRIYLNHWIKAADDDLHEGIHYTILFYGGALLAHLSASDNAVNDFIRLRDLNRNMAVIFDSDKSHEQDDIKHHVQRIVDELEGGTGIGWVTAGREIENYVDGSLLQRALAELHPRLYRDAGKTGRYDHSFYFWRTGENGRRETFKAADKVGAANLVCEHEADLTILDLAARLNELTSLIRRANGMKSRRD